MQSILYLRCMLQRSAVIHYISTGALTEKKHIPLCTVEAYPYLGDTAKLKES